MTELFAAAFAAGLMGSPHCIGMCGGFATACAGSARSSIAWHAGRLTTYSTLGALAGWAGAAIPGPRWLAAALSALLLIWFTGVLAGVFPQSTRGVPGLTRLGVRLIGKRDVASRYAFGLLTGLLPCGLLYAALSLAVAAETPLLGGIALFTFCLATVPGLALLSGLVHRLVAKGVWYRRGMAALILAAGLLSLGMRVQHESAAGTHSVHIR